MLVRLDLDSADEWASKGYTVLVPDVLSGDPISHDLLVRRHARPSLSHPFVGPH